MTKATRGRRLGERPAADVRTGRRRRQAHMIGRSKRYIFAGAAAALLDFPSMTTAQVFPSSDISYLKL